MMKNLILRALALVAFLGLAARAEATYQATVLADSPAVYLRLGEASGTTAADTSGNGHAGTYSAGWTLGSTPLLTGDGGTSALNNGASGTLISIPAGAYWNFGTGDFTLEAWCKTTATGTNNVLIGNDGTNATWWGIGVAGKLSFSNVASTQVGTAAVNNGSRHHLVITRTAGVCQFYVDGSADGPTFSGGDFSAAAGNSGTAVGVGNFEGGTFPLAGNLEEVAIYPTALSPTRVLAHYTAGSTGPSSTIAVSDANWFFSPYNWLVSGSTSATSVNPGAYLKIGFTGTSASLSVDVSAISGASTASKKYPRIRYSIDNGAYTTYQLLSSDTSVNLASGLTSGTHQLLLHFLASDAYTARWSGLMGLKVTGLVVDSGAASAAPTLRSGRLILFGDSIAEGAWSTGGPSDLTNYSDFEDATASFAAGVAEALGCEYGSCAFGGTAWDSVFNSDVPAFPNSWSFFYSTNSRLSAGLLTPAPTYVLNNLGANGGVASAATVTTWLGAIRTAAGPSAKVLQVIPFGGSGRANLTSGVQTYQAAHPTDPCYLIDLGTVSELAASSGSATLGSFDGLHPDIPTHGRLGALIGKAIQSATGGGGGGRRPIDGGRISQSQFPFPSTKPVPAPARRDKAA